MAFLKRRQWRGLVVQALILAVWWAVYTFVLRPLLPNGDVLGLAIVIVLSLSILAVPVLARSRRP